MHMRIIILKNNENESVKFRKITNFVFNKILLVLIILKVLNILFELEVFLLVNRFYLLILKSILDKNLTLNLNFL